MLKSHLRKFLWIALILPTLCFSKFLPPAQSTSGMVVTDQHLATQVGVNILKQGGNAIDAAVAIGYALAVVQPCCGNIGGGGFMLIHRKNAENIFINFREQAPAAISPKLFFNKQGKLDSKKSLYGYLAVGVPGTVMGLNQALKKYGTMPLKTVMAPAIVLAEKGFVLSKSGANFLKLKQKHIREQKNVAAIFLNNNQPYKAGELLRQENLANSLKLIANQGTQVFYHGSIAKKIVAASQAHGGVLSLKDFANYHISITKPVGCFYRGYEIITAPPPGSGAVICEMLNILKGYPLKQLGFHSAAAVHYNIEAMRYAFADRNRLLGDPDFIKIPLKKLLSEAYAAKIRLHIKPNKAGDSRALGLQPNKNGEKMQTTHYSVMDKLGNAVSVTYTINGYFGSFVIAGDTGFLLNNELDDFTISPTAPNLFKLIQSNANIIAPNKRPLSSMSPTIILENNKVVMLVGAAGGSTIITSILQTIENVIDFGMDINSAVNSPRFHMQWLPDITYMEQRAFSVDTMRVLRKMGHTLKLGLWGKRLDWGQVAALSNNPKTHIRYGANENRRPQGLAAGYNVK